MHILIAGGTGLIGKRLCQHLASQGHQVSLLSRRARTAENSAQPVKFIHWDGKTLGDWAKHLENTDAVINLSGAGIADRCWTKARKQELLNSRVDSARALASAVKACRQKPKVFIQTSGVGYYGTALHESFTEDSPPGNDFLAGLCQQWESSLSELKALGLRTVILRLGVVLDSQGGVLIKMQLPFYFFVGGPIGSGRQWLSWIHWQDLVEVFSHALNHETMSGVFNVAAPQPVTNAEFSRQLAKALHRPGIFKTPSLLIKWLLGEMSLILLQGQKVAVQKLTDSGFNFQFPQLEPALKDLLEKK